MASSKSHDLEITIISAKHLKKTLIGETAISKPYATFYLDNSDHRLATHADDSLSTRPVWNERFTLPITRQIYDSVLTLEIFHSKPSETPRPLVGTGKVRVKLEVKERPLPPPVQDYHAAPNYSHYYNPAPAPPPPPPPARDYREYSPSPYGYADPYGYYPAYYPPQPPLPSRPLYNRASSYSLPGGPSAPVDLSAQSSPSPYDHKPPPAGLFPKTSYYGEPSGPSAPVDYSHGKGSGSLISGAMGGLSLEEGSNYEKEKVAADKESRSYHDYRREY
ncbi:INGRESSION PROTEIN FIC1 [Salix viminalis]|uniref:INGRESSION PROTEIN FIC1 n=1 Tax=Salix viminalis TaxID=40686 RepID=A0A9Q0NIY4_SALVM|nr:INGRESSION PROTEIN FIC1 [Salix viminalis]